MSFGRRIELSLTEMLNYVITGKDGDMERPKTKTKNISCRFEPKLYNELKDFCTETGLSLTTAIERALKRYFEYYRTTGRS